MHLYGSPVECWDVLPEYNLSTHRGNYDEYQCEIKGPVDEKIRGSSIVCRRSERSVKTVEEGLE